MCSMENAVNFLLAKKKVQEKFKVIDKHVASLLDFQRALARRNFQKFA